MGHIYTHLYNSKCLLLYAKIACDILFHVTFSFSSVWLLWLPVPVWYVLLHLWSLSLSFGVELVGGLGFFFALRQLTVAILQLQLGHLVCAKVCFPLCL